MEPFEIEILLVEDNPHEAELTIRSLKSHHLANKLKLIDDGADAIDFIFSEGRDTTDPKNVFSPRLVLLDLKLPRVDGLEILRRMKTDERTRHIPVVILTSSKEERDIIDSYQLGANSYIVKPVNFQSFSKAVEELGLYWLVTNQPSSKH